MLKMPIFTWKGDRIVYNSGRPLAVNGHLGALLNSTAAKVIESLSEFNLAKPVPYKANDTAKSQG
jgi:hypothetical protein